MTAEAMTAEEELHWLALRSVPGLGTRRSVQLLERMKTPRAVFSASASELEGAGVPGTLARSIASGCSFDEAATQRELMMKAGATLVPLGHPAYPDLLRGIYDPPPVLFARGRLELLA